MNEKVIAEFNSGYLRAAWYAWFQANKTANTMCAYGNNRAQAAWEDFFLAYIGGGKL